MKYGYIDQYDVVTAKGKNLGDYVQTIAAQQFLPNDVISINRERLDEYWGGKCKVLMASWFMPAPSHFPYSEDIEPLFISSHYTERSLDEAFKRKESIEYFKRHEPIGCRDSYTVSVFERYGIKAYFSGCLTLTLGNTFRHVPGGNEILMVDVMYNYRTWNEFVLDMKAVPREFLSKIKHNGPIEPIRELFQNMHKRDKMLKRIFSQDFLDTATFISQLCVHKKDDDYLGITRKYLERLSKAQLVVTSRIHCALPCLAMGTPVIFIDSELDQPRISGLKDFFNHFVIEGNRITNNFGIKGKIGLSDKIENPTRHLPYAENLEKQVRNFIKG